MALLHEIQGWSILLQSMLDKKKIAAFKKTVQERFPADLLLFVPAGFLVLLGISTLLAPTFIIGIIAAFFVFLGGVSFVLARKIICFRKQFDHFLRTVRTEVRIEKAPIKPPDAQQEEDLKKIILH